MIDRKESGPELGFGFARLPLKDKTDQSSIDHDLLNKMTDSYIANGGRYFDTAYMYHDFMSEAAIGRAVSSRYPRDRFLLATKLPVGMLTGNEMQEEIFAEQLKRCRVDYFDIYLLHSVMGSVMERIDAFKCFDFIKKKLESGKIRHIGISYHDDAALLDKILKDHPDIEYVQLQINYLDWDDPIVQSGRCYDVAESHGKKVIVMEPVKGGALSKVPKGAMDMFESCNPGSSPSEWALRFAASLKQVRFILSGMSTLDQIESNTRLFSNLRGLDRHETEVINTVKDHIKSAISIPCTSCHYCTVGCPKKIPIPDYFALYNSFRFTYKHNDPGNFFTSQEYYYRAVMANSPMASECIKCGKCEKVCPQHIRCIEELRKVADCFENMKR